MKEKKELEKRVGNSAGIGSSNLVKILGGAALVLGAALVIVSLPDIKRYIKISTM
ncbi:MAG TPA: hypothetical protein VNB22_23640 [Pyrinomonadaceae bacterium]|jgi:hypothetical protein|nr:hypothetical protein [Pyrinomonadaceae bacterium]